MIPRGLLCLSLVRARLRGALTHWLCSLQGPYDRSATFFGDMTGAGRRLARKRWPWPNSLRRLSPDYDYPPFRGLMWTTSRPSGSPARYSASQPPRTDCPNLAASHLCRSIPWAWALNTPQPIQCVIQVHIPGLHSATNPESSKDRGWTTGSTPSTTTTRSRSNSVA